MIIFLKNYLIRRAEKIHLKNIKIDHKYFTSIKNPTEEMCKLAMTKYFDHFYSMKNPSDDLIIHAILLQNSLFSRLKVQNYKICKAAILHNKKNIYNVDPDQLSKEEHEDIVFECLDDHPISLSTLKIQDPEYCLKCLNKNPESYKFINIVQSNSSQECEEKLKNKIKLLDLIK